MTGTIIKKYIQANDGATNGEPYTATFYSSGTDNEIWNSVKAAFTAAHKELTDANCFVRWSFRKSDGTYADPEAYNLGQGRVRFYFNGVGGEEYRTQGLIKNSYQYMYTSGNLPSNTYGLNTKLNATINFGTNVFQLGGTLECYITNDSQNANSDPADGYIVKVEINFNENGLPPYNLINETDIASTKKFVIIKNYSSAGKLLDVSDALVSGAKYFRVYLSKYGNAISQSDNLVVKYDDAVVTQCESGNTKYGWYYSVTDDSKVIDPAKLSIAGLDADEMLKYNVVIVSSSQPLSGDKEPAWEKKTVYSFQKEIKNRVNSSETEQYVFTGVNLQSEILSAIDANVSDFSKTLYAKWYILDPDNSPVSIVGGSGANDANNWTFNIFNNGKGDWKNESNIYKFYTDQPDNANSSKTKIEDDPWNYPGAWKNQIAKADGVYVPQNKHTSDYVGYKVVFEFSDEYDTSTNGADPGYKLKYIWTIVDPSAFTGDQNTGGETASTTQTVTDRDATSVTVDLATTAFAHSKLEGSSKAKYARFYLTDADGKLVDPTGKLVVSYSGGIVTACTKTEQGFYIYDGLDGGDISELNLNNITVQLTTPKAYKLYKVVGVFSTEMAEVVPEGGAKPLSREPDWDLKYTYSFTYPAPTTKEIARDFEWRRNGMMPVASTSDPDTDWATSWEELSLGQYVKWYVVNGSGIQQTLVSGTERQAGTTDWAINVEGYTIDSNAAVLTGETTFNSSRWNTWEKPDIYAPAGVDFDDVKSYQVLCEIYSNETGTGNPNARYTFSLIKSFLGELKDTGTEASESIEMDRTSTSESLSLTNALSDYGGGTPKYARVWLTKTDGTRVDPTGLLSVTGMTGYTTEEPTNADFGYYLSDEGGIDLSSLAVSLSLSAGQYGNYQVHVALSTNALTTPITTTTYEPDYDYVYTFKFHYPVKTKYKTALYDDTTRSTTIQLLSNWFEVAGDCDASRQQLADKGYVRWYLENATTGEMIAMANLTASDSYTQVASDAKYGYYRLGFDKAKLPSAIWSGTGFADPYFGYNPTITLPDEVNYNDVRVVCEATTKTDGVSIPSEQPSEIQIKYVYVLKKQTELEEAPFVHYVGESHRDYKIVSGTPGDTQLSWNYETGLVDATTYASQNIRQDVYQTDYYVYLDPSNTSAANLLLKLPMEHWDKNPEGNRNSTEPLGYFRWYDWNTDMKSAYLETAGSANKLVQRSDNRGLVALMLSGSSSEIYRNEIGVKFTGLSALDSNKEIVIACDVSRYMDGLDDTRTYLVHEPTLTMRYLFHILPSSVIANAIDSKASLLKAVNDGTKDYSTMSTIERVQMFQTYEDNGRVVVSLNGTKGKFSLRADLQDLSQYFINNSGTPVQCNKMQWYCYYEDNDGLWKKAVSMGDRGSLRLAKYEESEFNGTYTKVGSSETKEVTIGNGATVHLVGYIGNGSAEQAVVHYGLEFLNEAPAVIGSEPEHRRDDVMRENLSLGNVLDFNNFFIDPTTRFNKPTNSYENYAKIPMSFTDAQYGFCYPQLYGQCASNWMINHGAGWDGYGFAPTHGDYTILKSMNMARVSASRTYDNQSIYTFWYNDGLTPLYDVTHERLDPGKSGNDAKYGSFLYVDASDEARTISQLQFTAPLCAGSQIYYTAYIANMTGIEEQDPPRDHVPSQTPPQVLFRVSMDVTEGGVTKRVPVVSFLTGDLYTVGATAGGTWYQVYGYTRIPKEFESIVDGDEHTYYVSIDNYAENTDGADYAIDQISFFTSSAKVRVNQVSTPCDEASGVELSILAEADELINVIGQGNTKTLYYRIFEKSDEPNHIMLPTEAVSGPYKNEKPTDEMIYGSAVFNASYDLATVPTALPEGETTGFYKDTDGKVMFQFDKRTFNLKNGKKYFVSFYAFEKSEVREFEHWGGPYGQGICSAVFSNDIVPNALRIDLESGGEAFDGNISLGCGVPSITKSFIITVQYPVEDGYNPHTDITFDFYMGSKAEFKAIKVGDLYLERALDHMRTYRSTAVINSSSELSTTYDVDYTEAMHDILATYIDNGSLHLDASRTFSYTFTSADGGVKKFAAIPVSRNTSDGYICSPLELEFEVTASSNAPKMELGFDDVTYPAEYTKRVVRVGLEQLNNMKKSTDSYKLHIPVSNYQNKGGSSIGNKLHFTNPYLMLSKTNDPSIVLTSTQKKIAKLFDPNGGLNATDVYVNTNRMYLPLDFSGENCEVEFHEGYWYEASLSFYDEEDNSLAESERCIGDLYLIFKVVPEFVTWNARSVGTDLYSGNWDDDDNWNRSTRAELYKSDSQNSPSAGHLDTDLYKDNPDIDEKLTDRPGFVPMKFTYVTMLGGNHSPSLFNESYAGKISGSVQSGGDLINPLNAMGTDTSPSGGSSNATPYILYDMMVRYGEDGCKGHRYMKSNGAGGYVWNDDWNTSEHISSLTKVYDVEKFYGNICKEIYFKPGAELRLQQRLKYEKAWVEEELEPNRWYLMSTPLKGTYAGDMYVPATAKKDYSQAGTPSVTGRQVTEAFQAITFDKDKGYSRTQYPFYQRSWGLQSSKVYTKTDDVRGNEYSEYSAYLKFPTQISSDVVEWSHTYNDVQVPYNNYSGFAIRANRKTTDKALIRLPKADTSYDYYQWDNTVPASGAVGAKTVTKGEELYGRFVFDNTSANQEQWTIPLGQLQAQGTDEDGYTYYLVGNPFMASIDMGKFFGYLDSQNSSTPVYYAYNEKLSPVYYIYKDGAAKAVDATAEITDKSERIIRPLQAFIVKCNAADPPDNIVFNRWAITDGNYTDPTRYVPQGSQSGGNNPSRTRALTLKATNDGGSSTASVNLSEAASDGYAAEEDATTLFDSNLSDVPVVYTVAGNKAVSIDTRSAIDIVPFGVACVASNELVSVKLSWSEERGVNRLYVLDAVTGEMTEVTDGQSLSVQPNDYGRYFLTTRGDLTAIREATAKGIVVSVRNKTVTVRSSEPLTTVRVMTTGGNVVNSLSNCGTEASIPMAIGGVYLVEAQTANNKKTMKVMVK